MAGATKATREPVPKRGQVWGYPKPTDFQAENWFGFRRPQTNSTGCVPENGFADGILAGTNFFHYRMKHEGECTRLGFMGDR